MIIRPHRGSLSDSMAEAVEIQSTLDAVVEWANTVHFVKATHSNTKVVLYSADARIGWDEVYIVTVDNAPIGFTNTTCK